MPSSPPAKPADMRSASSSTTGGRAKRFVIGSGSAIMGWGDCQVDHFFGKLAMRPQIWPDELMREHAQHEKG